MAKYSGRRIVKLQTCISPLVYGLKYAGSNVFLYHYRIVYYIVNFCVFEKNEGSGQRLPKRADGDGDDDEKGV